MFIPPQSSIVPSSVTMFEESFIDISEDYIEYEVEQIDENYIVPMPVVPIDSLKETNKKIKEITKLILKKIKYVVLDADALTCFKNDLKSLYSLLDKNKIIFSDQVID